MRTWAKGSAPAAMLAVGVMAFTGGTAFADTSGSGSVGGGNQLNLPISLPIDISGNAVGVAGDSSAASKGGASVENASGGIPGETSGDGSVLGGNQVNAPISAPVNACGNAISLFGSSDAGCKGGSSVKNSGRQGAGGNITNGDHSLLGGNQITAPISAPVNACGNALAIFGDAAAGCKGGASVQNTGFGPGGNRTSGRSSLLGGNQVIAPISGPINICGNSIAFFGEAFSGCKGGSSVSNTTGGHGGTGKPGHGYMHSVGGSGGNDTDGRFGAGSGNQVIAPVGLPVNLCGNAVGNAPAGCEGGASVQNAGAGAGGNRTSGRSGVLGGNQVIAPITAPLNVCGNAMAAAGHAFAGCRGGASVRNGGQGAGGNVTSGRSGVLAGNQVVAPITAPINACGNAAAVLGESEAHCKGGAFVDGGQGGGGNRTSGKYGVAAGNQVVAPISAPVNVCGNAAAVLGDAAAGCLGGARVGRHYEDDHDGYAHWTRSWGKVTTARASGLLPGLPAVPALSGVKDVGNLTQQMSASGMPSLPVVGDMAGSLGLPSLPGLPGLPGAPGLPGGTAHAQGPAAIDAAPAQAAGPLAPASNLAGSLPVAGSASQMANALPVGDLGLMSAEQPIGLTGMNMGSLVGLLLGALFAASAALFVTTRRPRPGRR